MLRGPGRSTLTGSSFIGNIFGRTFRDRVRAGMAARDCYQESCTLVTPAWLESRIREGSQQNARKLHVLDCTWYLPNANRDPIDEFIHDGRIRTAKFFDLDAVADQQTDLPHMLCSEGAFAAAMDALEYLSSMM
jgi:hypothetical protein